MQKPRSRLGRGMNSLLSLSEPNSIVTDTPSLQAADVAPINMSTVAGQPIREGTVDGRPPARQTPGGDNSLFHVELDHVIANPHQPRRTFEPVALAELAASLKSSGLIQPIVVRPVGDHYELVAGERRLRAAKLAGLPTVPAILREVDSLQQAQLALIENIHREDLNPIERALAYRQLIDQLGLTQEELSTRLGEERSSIANFLRLLDLTDTVRQAVIERKISMGHAKILASVKDVVEQERLTQLVTTEELTVRNLERLMSEMPKPVVERPQRTTAHIADLEKRLSRSLEMRVEVKQAKKGGQGRLILHYASLDQFDDLLAKLQFEVD